MTQPYQPLKKRIEQWIIRVKRANLTNTELAKLAGISRTQLSNIIRGQAKNPKVSTIDKIEQVLESKGV